MDPSTQECCGGHFLPSGGPRCDPESGQALPGTLQVLCDQASSLLSSLYYQQQTAAEEGHQEQNVQRHQPLDGMDKLQCAAALQQFAWEAIDALTDALQEAVPAKQPLLATSSAHCRAFVQLLDQLWLLDLVKDSTSCLPNGLDQWAAQQWCSDAGDEAVPFGGSTAQAFLCSRRVILQELYTRVQPCPGIQVVLAQIIERVYQWLDSSSAALSTSQQLHTYGRALPLLLRLYFETSSRTEAMVAGRPEALSPKLLSACIQRVISQPVLPGYGDVPAFLLPLLDDCQPLLELAQRHAKLSIVPLGQLDSRQQLRLEGSYSLAKDICPLRQAHDTISDAVSALALEVEAAQQQGQEPGPEVDALAWSVVAQSLSFLAGARGKLMELDAWRLHAADQQSSSGHSSRYQLCDTDAVPFLELLTSLKGIQGLLSDCSPWMAALLRRHAAQQLQAFASTGLPALAKAHASSKRVQQLAQAIQEVLLGQHVNLPADMWASSQWGADAAHDSMWDAAGEAAIGARSGTSAADFFDRGAADGSVFIGAGPVGEGLEFRLHLLRRTRRAQPDPQADERQQQGNMEGEQLHQTEQPASTVQDQPQGVQQQRSLGGWLKRVTSHEAAQLPPETHEQAAPQRAGLLPTPGEQHGWPAAAVPASGEQRIGLANNVADWLLGNMRHSDPSALEADEQEQQEQHVLPLSAEGVQLSLEASGAAVAAGDAARPPPAAGMLQRIAQQAKQVKAATMSFRRRLSEAGASSSAADGVPHAEAAEGAAALDAGGLRAGEQPDQGGGVMQRRLSRNTSNPGAGVGPQVLSVLRDKFRYRSSGGGGVPPGAAVEPVLLPDWLVASGPPPSQLELLELLVEQLLLAAASEQRWRPVAKGAEAQAAELVAALPLLGAAHNLLAPLAVAGDLSDLWLSTVRQMPGGSISVDPMAASATFPGALMQRVAWQLEYMPAETPLAATHVFEDAAARLRCWQGCSMPPPLLLLLEAQAGAALSGYLEEVTAMMFQHFKTLALHQLVVSDLLVVCGASAAGSLPAISPLSFQSLLAHYAVQAAGARINIRQVLTCRMEELLEAEARQLAEGFSVAGATALVDLQHQVGLLRGTHTLLAQHLKLPTWRDMWEAADAAAVAAPDSGCGSGVAAAAISSLLSIAQRGVFDSAAQTLLPAAHVPQPELPAPAGQHSASRALHALLAGYSRSFGAQHMAALHQLVGSAGLAALMEALVARFEGLVQGPLSSALVELQHLLPSDLQEAPSCEQRASAEQLLCSYQARLSATLEQPSLSRAALCHLQEAGNCLLLLQMVEACTASGSSAAFMQVAPLLGVQAADRGAADGSACLTMPPPDELSRFQRLLLGPDAHLVVGLPKLLVQSAELRAWEATQGTQLLATCMQRVDAAARQLQAALLRGCTASPPQATPVRQPHGGAAVEPSSLPPAEAAGVRASMQGVLGELAQSVASCNAYSEAGSSPLPATRQAMRYAAASQQLAPSSSAGSEAGDGDEADDGMSRSLEGEELDAAGPFGDALVEVTASWQASEGEAEASHCRQAELLSPGWPRSAVASSGQASPAGSITGNEAAASPKSDSGDALPITSLIGELLQDVEGRPAGAHAAAVPAPVTWTVGSEADGCGDSSTSGHSDGAGSDKGSASASPHGASKLAAGVAAAARQALGRSLSPFASCGAVWDGQDAEDDDTASGSKDSPRQPLHNSAQRNSRGGAGRPQPAVTPLGPLHSGAALEEMYDEVADLSAAQQTEIGRLRSENVMLRSEVASKDEMILMLASASKALHSPRSCSESSSTMGDTEQVEEPCLLAASPVLAYSSTPVPPAGCASPALNAPPQLHVAPAAPWGTAEALGAVLAANAAARSEHVRQGSLEVTVLSNSSDDSASSPRTARERTFPILLHSSPPPAPLAVAWSALRFVLLQQFVSSAPQPATGVPAGAAGSVSAAAAAGSGASPTKALVKMLYFGLAGKQQVAGARMLAPEATAAAQMVEQQPSRALLLGGATAGGEFGDGPLWAACVLLHLAGQQHIYQRVDVCGQLAHKLRFEEVQQQQGGSGAADSSSLAQLRQLAAANARSEQVWQQAAASMGRRFALQPPPGSCDLAFTALDGEAATVVGPDEDPLASLPVQRQCMRVVAPAAEPAVRQCSPTKLAPGGRRPMRAPPKAGLVQAARAHSVAQRFAQAAPSAAVSSSARRDRGSDDRLSMRSMSSAGRSLRRVTLGDVGANGDQAAAAEAGSPGRHHKLAAAAGAGRSTAVSALGRLMGRNS